MFGKITNRLKKFVKRVIWRYRANSQTYVEWLRKQGCEIGGGFILLIHEMDGLIFQGRGW